jgi:hypothetical protein
MGRITDMPIGLEVNLRSAIGSRVYSCASAQVAEVRIDAKSGGHCWQSGTDKASGLQALLPSAIAVLSPSPRSSLFSLSDFARTFAPCDLFSLSSAQMVDL